MRNPRSARLVGLACAGALGLAASWGIAACGEDRGSVEIQGGGTTGTTGTTGTAGTTPTTTTAP